MANLKAAKKSIRSDARKRVFNLRRKRAMKEAVQAVEKELTAGKAKEASAALPQAYKAIDKAVKRGVIKKNTGARKKSRLTAALKKASAK